MVPVVAYNKYIYIYIVGTYKSLYKLGIFIIKPF